MKETAINHLLSLDWGTTRFRLRVIDVPAAKIIGLADGPGIRETYGRWREAGGERAAFYRGRIEREARRLERRLEIPLAGAPVVASGMGSSSIGIAELPYAELPFPLDGSECQARWIDGRLVLLSGVAARDDVMRGEETEMIGLWSRLSGVPDGAVFVLPGTHSKHVRVRGGAIETFATHMTGEVFSALAHHTILAESVATTPWEPRYQDIFLAGVSNSRSIPLLNALFRVRACGVLGHWPRAEAYWYLSGLLVGSELAGLAVHSPPRVYLSAADVLHEPYAAAMRVLFAGKFVLVERQLAAEAAAWGHLEMYRRLRVRRPVV